MNPRDLVRVAASKGYNVLGVADHNTTKGATVTKRIARKGIMIIPGEEITTNYGEVIVFLSDGKYNRNLEDICERAQDENHFIVVSHPFDFLRKGSIKSNIEKASKIDAIEVFNSRVVLQRFNERAEEYAKINNIPIIAGSDAHLVEEIGNVTCILDCDRSVDSILSYVTKGKLVFEGRKSSLLVHLKSSIIKQARVLL